MSDRKDWEGQSGFIVDSGDFKSAAQRLLTLLENPQKAKQMGERGRQIIESNFTAQAMVNDLTRLYDGLLASKQLRKVAQ